MADLDAVFVVLTHGNCFVGAFATEAAARAEAGLGFVVDRVELPDAEDREEADR